MPLDVTKIVVTCNHDTHVTLCLVQILLCF